MNIHWLFSTKTVNTVVLSKLFLFEHSDKLNIATVAQPMM